MINILFIFHEWMLFILRLTVGFIFLARRFPQITQLKHGILWEKIKILLEFIGGIFLILGFFTPYASLLLALEVLILFLWKLKRKESLAARYEFSLLLFIALLVLATTGNAIFSLDEFLFYFFP